MSLKTVQLLQVGDVHWPEAQQRAADIKGKGQFIMEKKSALTEAEEVIGYLSKFLDEQDAILLMGDLTDKGRLEHYGDFLDRLGDLLGDKGNREKVHIVPGNHDIDRSLCYPDEERLLLKFAPLEAAVREKGYPDLPVDGPVRRLVVRDAGQMCVVALNSCLGCGASRRYIDLPARIMEAFAELADNVKDFPKAVYEELDTPLFDPAHLNDAVNIVGEYDPFEVLAVVFAHHNLLPQERPRLVAFGELVNGGTARAKLTEMGRPVLYLHGHIHTAPVEVITSPKSTGSRVISISAPAFLDGFNRINVEYNEMQYPLGCVVEEWRRKENGSSIIELKQATRIPFWSPTEARRVLSATAKQVFQHVVKKTPPPPDWTRLPKLMSKAPCEEEALVQGLRELEWLGLVAIDNLMIRGKYTPLDEWLVRRVI